MFPIRLTDATLRIVMDDALGVAAGVCSTSGGISGMSVPLHSVVAGSPTGELSAPRVEWVGDRAACVDPRGLDLGVLIHRVQPVLAAHTRLAEAAERPDVVDLSIVVDP